MRVRRSRAAFALTIAVAVTAAVTVPDASARQVAWIRQDGSNQWDTFSDVAATRSAAYAVGVTEGGVLPGQTFPPGGHDAVLRRYATDGTVRWTTQFGTPATDIANGVSAFGSAVYVVGTTEGVMSGPASAGGVDAFLRRYDPSGEIRWTRQFGTSGSDTARAVVATAAGVVVVGQTTGAFPDETSAGSEDAFIRMYGPGGQLKWTDQFGSASHDDGLDVAMDSTGIYVSGHAGDALPGQTAAGNFDVFVRKYDLAGTRKWTRQFGTIGSDNGFGISVAPAGVFVAGRAGQALPGGTHVGNYDAFVRRYRRDGTVVWTRQFGTAGDDSASGVAATRGGVFVSGQTGGTLSGQSSAGNPDAFVRKYDAAGKVVWTRQYGTPGFDAATGVSAARHGVFASTATDNTFPGETSAGGGDLAMARIVSYQPDGSISRAARSGYVGDGVYNRTGAGQLRGVSAPRGGSRTLFIRVQNDGDAVDRLTVEGCRRTKGARVRYLAGIEGAKDVTDAVVAGTYSPGAIDPSANKVLRVVLTVRKDAAVGSVGRCKVVLGSTESVRQDAVVAQVTVTN
jgi:hypothetical protein